MITRLELGLMADLHFCVPLLPPTVNHYVKHTRTGRHYITKEAEAFMEAIPLCAKQKRVRHKFYAIEIYVTLGPKTRLDLDNCTKVILDGLVKGGQIHSDAAVTGIFLHKKRGPESRTCITIWEGKKP